MKILVSGSSGLVGSALVPLLSTRGHSITRLVRQDPQPGQVQWDPERGTIEAARLAGFDAVVHLAGQTIAGAKWTAEQKARIRVSRVKGTRILSEALAALPAPPQVMICASAIGYYGNRGDEVLREESPAGSGFLPEVCRAWEAAAEPARKMGIRVTNLRTGVVLSAGGGALPKMLPAFKLGIGGVIGSGRQYMSWIALDDVVGAIDHALSNTVLDGPVNAVAPHPVTNREFTVTLGRVLSRPTLFPMPAFAVRLAFGEMADELLLASQRVEPAKLASSGYKFQFSQLEGALRHALGK